MDTDMSAPVKADPGGPAHQQTMVATPAFESLGAPIKREPASPCHIDKPWGPVNPQPGVHAEDRIQPQLQPETPGKAEPQEQAKPKEQPLQASYLQQLITLNNPIILEKGVRIGAKVLDELKVIFDAFSPVSGTDATRWLKAIHDLQSRPRQGRTIVGVVGNTGAGKSSVINALFDEERLLPTSCLRACTASATEVSYNTSDDPRLLYRAEIEFITADDWRNELEALFDDLLSSIGKISRDATTGDTDARRAYDKIRAVYNNFTKDDIENSDPATLADHYTVRPVLGTVKKFHATTAPAMYRQLQAYVDSKEKTAAADKTIEYWPLIKVVRIYCKADALSTGAVIVDLPGVQDSNAARAAVAANYMKQCSGLWIVAPITRAVDDKTAKKLLGDSFKRQLKYDGIYSAVTFICSKTDDISIIEAADSLNLDGELGITWEKIEDIKRDLKQVVTHIGELKDEKAAFCEMLEDVDDEVDKWDDLSKKLSGGRTVYAPLAANGSRKRKRTAKPSGSRKNRVSLDIDSDNDPIMSDSDSLSSSDKENGDPDDGSRVPLTEEDIEQAQHSLKARKKEFRKARKEMDEKIRELREEIKNKTSQKNQLESQIKAACIKGRNEYSRDAIKQDFALGIKELDEETAMELDEANFDPEQDLRDYNQVAKSLPVFCVSSRAYQQLCGRLKKDNFSKDGFDTPQDTEVPQLQEHAKKLTEAGRALNARVFLNDFSRLINSMKLWADNDGTSQFTNDEKEVERRRLCDHLSTLEQNLQESVNTCVNTLKEELTENVFETLNKTIPLAAQAAPSTAGSWGHGMRWSTYKATVRRSGVFAGASGPKDFNADLWAPVAMQLSAGWERTFQRRLPTVLQIFVLRTSVYLDEFHTNAIAYAREHCINLAGITVLDQQVQTYKTRIKELPTLVSQIIQEIQKEASRSFTPTIMEDMQPAYTKCAEERGVGSYKRMQHSMREHVDSARQTMFNHAVDNVRNQLDAMCDRICDELETHVLRDIFQHLSRDYLSVLVGGDGESKNFSALTRAERMMRGEVASVLSHNSDKVFKHCLPREDPPGDGRADNVDVDMGDEEKAPAGPLEDGHDDGGSEDGTLHKDAPHNDIPHHKGAGSEVLGNDPYQEHVSQEGPMDCEAN